MEKLQPLSEENLKRLEKALQRLREHKEPYLVKVLGKDFIVLPNVFSPDFIDSRQMAKLVKGRTPENALVLDLGTGSGVQAIFAAEKSEKVVATDAGKSAVDCAKQNVKKHCLEGKVETRKGNLFGSLKAGEKFDLIIFNPPFRHLKARDEIERTVTDENYKVLTRFFRQAKRLLKMNGKILLAFSTLGDEKFLKKLVSENGFTAKELERIEDKGFEFFVLEIKCKEDKQAAAGNQIP